MNMETPFSILNRTGKPARFSDIPVGTTFAVNGNVWTKRTTRTASGIWPACLPAWAYFRGSEIVAMESAQ